MAKERSAYFDNLKGVLIILVVMGHLAAPIGTADHHAVSAIVDFFFIFHMPLFIFVSGLFCKSAYRDGRFRSDVVLFYLVVCLLMYTGLQLEIMSWGNDKAYNPFTLGGGSVPWYLMALAIYVGMTPFFSRIRPSIAVSAAVVVACAAGYFKLGDVFTASRVVVFLPFFLMGYYVNPKTITGVIDRLDRGGALFKLRILAVCILVVAFIALLLCSNEMLVYLKGLFKGRSSYGQIIDSSGVPFGRLRSCGFRFVYYAGVALISACVMLLVPRRSAGLLTRTGLHSLQVYVLHAFVYYACNNWTVAANMYAVFPDVVAGVLPFVEGIVLSLLLGYPNFIQTGFTKLKHACSLALLKEESPK